MADYLNKLFSNELIYERSPNRSIEITMMPTDKVPVKLMVMSGTYYDRGFFYGLHHSQGIKHVIHKTDRFMTRIGLGREHIKSNKEEIFKKSPSVFSHVPLHYFEEIRGVIDGCIAAGNPLDDERDIVIYMTFFEMNEQTCCSMFGIQPPDSIGSTFHLNNSEYPYPTGFDEYPHCLLHHPQNGKGEKSGYSFFQASPPALMGSLTGINEKGLTFSQIRATFMKGGFSDEGIPYTYLIQDALRTCQNTNEAFELFKDKPKTNPKFYTVSDPQKRDDSVQLWFTAPEFMYKYKPGEMPDISLVTREDFAFYKPFDHSVYWLDMFAPGCILGSEKAYEAISKRIGRIDEREALEITKELGSRYLVLSILYDIDNKLVWFSGSYKRIPAHEREYLHLDLKKYFRE